MKEINYKDMTFNPFNLIGDECRQHRLFRGSQAGTGLQETLSVGTSGKRIPLSGNHRRELSPARLPYNVRWQDREGAGKG